MWCCVSFFCSGGEIVFGVTYIRSVQYSCAVVSVFLLWRESLFCTNTLQSRSFLKNIENFLCKKLILYKTYIQEDQLFLALYGSTAIQTQLFLKNIANFVWFPKQYLLGVLILEKQHANIPGRGFLFLRNTLLLYSLSPYSQTERWMESQIHSLRIGWRNLFSSCAVVSVFCSGGKLVLVLHTYIRYLTNYFTN